MRSVVLGLNHKTAPVDVRETFSFGTEETKDALNRIYEYEEVAECVIVSTCNRTELYAVLEDVEEPFPFMLNVLRRLKWKDFIDERHFFFYADTEMMTHLFRVAAGFDSLVLGEGQILSQIKGAYINAYARGMTGPVFNILFQKAISVGKKVRTVTDIDGTPVSVSYTAVNLAEDALDFPLSDAKVLILGAGEMSELTARHLQAKGVRTMFVSNRTYGRAEALAEMFGGTAVSFDSFIEQAKEADILITSTGAPHYIIGRDEAKAITAGRKKPVVMIDIAVPRDIDPEVAMNDSVVLFNIDSLESVVEENKQRRADEAKKSEPLIAAAVADIEEKLGYLSVRPIMVLLSDKAERIRRREVHRAMAKLPDAGERERRIIETMSRMLVRKLLRDPMIRFGEVAGKDEEGEYWNLFREMFDLKKESGTL